ncbi:uncharacterized protein N7500_008538 [Penicillium coprophilum]|uniref:uncharacterized protein n=1 Tax=Penicillium coprophilum TaxID=36646 RepID=UPI002392E6B9|nr:uncharacterized protein N7500_008538 [Penicillium coprophilum]KAJ5158887.1 hypothetical protein N7500_008538 [Penicillium coprophilum]
MNGLKFLSLSSRQLSETKLAESVTTKLQHIEELPKPQKYLIKRILTLLSPILDQEIYQHTKAINTVTAYYQFKEGLKVIWPRAVTSTIRSQKAKRLRDISKYIKRKHLQNLSSSTIIAYNIYNKKFAEVIHFQRYANDSYSTMTRPL